MRVRFSRYRRRKAVSEIIATLLMILLVVCVGTAIFAYTSSGLGSFSANFSNLISNQGEAVAQQFSLDLATFNLTSGTLPYVVLSVSNSETSSTPAPFQEMITINPSLYTSYEAGDLGNIRFFSTFSGGSFSSPLDSWLESASSSPSNNALSAVFWVNLPSGIPATSSADIYMVFEPVSTEFDGTIAGEAPQLSLNYGEYDNGENVFSQYGGASWSSFTFQSGTWTTSNGYLQQTSTSASGGTGGGPTALIEGTQYPVTGSYVLEMAFSYSGQASPRVGIVADATPVGAAGSGTVDTSAYRFIGQQNNNGRGFVSFLNDLVAWVVSNLYQGSTGTPYSMQVTDAGGTWSGNLYPGYSVTGSPLSSLAPTTYTNANQQGATSGYVGISAGYYTGSQVVGNPVSVQWFRMRAYPPNGVMPSISYGSMNFGSQAGADVYVQNSGSLPISIASIYVTNLSSNELVGAFILNPVVTIQTGEFQKIPVYFVPVNGVAYQFTVVTTLGTKVISTFSA